MATMISVEACCEDPTPVFDSRPGYENTTVGKRYRFDLYCESCDREFERVLVTIKSK